MASSRASSRVFNTLFPFSDFVWVLQKEEYDLTRYLLWLRRFLFRRTFTIQEKLVPTKRALLVLMLSVLLWAGLVVLVGLYVDGLYVVLGVLVSLLLIPLLVFFSALLLSPFFALAHALVRRRASLLLARRSDLTVIAVAGSYGKTTTKNFLFELLRFHHQVQMIPGNINTPAGLAAWLCRNIEARTKILIVEADAYNTKDMRQTARVLRPHLVLVTNVGDQHLERFGSKKRLAKALMMLSRYARVESLTFADAETLPQICGEGRECKTVATDLLLFMSEVLEAPQLSTSNRTNLARTLAVVERFKVPSAFVRDAVLRIEPPERRQRRGTIRGYEGIDDSYNISLTTATEGLKAAHAFALERGRKLIVVTGGIPELGPEEKDGNVQLGQKIALSADYAAVLGTMFANDLMKGVGTSIPSERYRTLDEFFAKAESQFPTSEWVILLQPALPDLYY